MCGMFAPFKSLYPTDFPSDICLGGSCFPRGYVPFVQSHFPQLPYVLVMVITAGMKHHDQNSSGSRGFFFIGLMLPRLCL